MSVIETTPVSPVDGSAANDRESVESCRIRRLKDFGRHIRAFCAIYLNGMLVAWQQVGRAFRWVFDSGQPNILFRSDRPDLASAWIHQSRLPTRMMRRVDNSSKTHPAEPAPVNPERTDVVCSPEGPKRNLVMNFNTLQNKTQLFETAAGQAVYDTLIQANINPDSVSAETVKRMLVAELQYRRSLCGSFCEALAAC